MEKPENKNPGQVGHSAVAGNITQTLVGTPNTKNQPLKVKGKIKFGMKGVPTG